MKQPKLSQKRVHLKPKHASPYRKRHYALLVGAVGVAFLLFGILISLRVHLGDGMADSKAFVQSTYSRRADTKQTVSSSNGFNFSYDPRRLYASAIDGSTGKLYIGYELSSERPYQTIKLSTKVIPHVASTPDTILIDYYGADETGQSLIDAERAHVGGAQNGQALTVVSTELVTERNLTFQKTVWSQSASGPLAPQLQSHFVSYTTLIGGQTVILRTNNRLGASQGDADLDAIVHSLVLGQPAVSYVVPSPVVASRVAKSQSLLDTLLFTSASAAMVTDSQTVSALYAPAVIKIYNAYCTDIAINNQPYLSNACSAASGSGFFISSDGYIATNGHVATESAKDLVIQDAYAAAAVGNGKPLVQLAQLAGLNIGVLSAIKDDATLLDTIFNGVYAMPDSAFTKTRNVQNLLVGLDSKDPDVNKLLKMTNARQVYAADDNLKAAQVISADYRAADGVVKYRNSDVAIIKIDGNNYPVAKLGDLSEVSQGSVLNILGYPAAASNNGIVAHDVSAVTLTSGKVSSIKTANGDTRKLIETDTTIGHGNSGGPVLGDNGDVVGIATYTIDGGGQGNGTFNYIRDIQDLKTLATHSNLTFNTFSRTQNAWQQAIAAFDSSHYSKSIAYFDKVQALYPQHPTVDSFIARAQASIQQGKDVKDMPVALLIGGLALAIVIAGAAITFIIRHHGKHQVYKMANGQMTAAPVNQSLASSSAEYSPPQSPAPGEYLRQDEVPQHIPAE